jgi:hypothetical protein
MFWQVQQIHLIVTAKQAHNTMANSAAAFAIQKPLAAHFHALTYFRLVFLWQCQPGCFAAPIWTSSDALPL